MSKFEGKVIECFQNKTKKLNKVKWKKHEENCIKAHFNEIF